jgi:membrane associated rhomboid family serine protease
MNDQALGAREPAFNSPWPAIALPAVILAAYALQSAASGFDAAAAFGFSPAALREGRWSGLLTAMFVHSGWPHAGLNAMFALAFGAPVARRIGARRIGVGGLGALIFFAFYLVCGALASLGFALVHPDAPVVLVGASGAVSGLMGVASRMIGIRPATAPLAPFTSPTVIGLAVSWIVINGLMAVFGAPGLADGAGGAPVAWEAHLFGYAAGLALIGPLLGLLRRD